VVDTKRIIRKNGGLRRRRVTRGRWPKNKGSDTHLYLSAYVKGNPYFTKASCVIKGTLYVSCREPDFKGRNRAWANPQNPKHAGVNVVKFIHVIFH
jgi:hypothetical protein